MRSNAAIGSWWRIGTGQRSLRYWLLVAMAISATTALSQQMTSNDVKETAADFATLVLPSRPTRADEAVECDYRLTEPGLGRRRGLWMVSFPSCFVFIDDGDRAAVSVTFNNEFNLDNADASTRFVPWYRNLAEVIEVARELAGRLGLSDYNVPLKVLAQVPDSDGTVWKRRVSVVLVPRVYGQIPEVGGNGLSLSIDSKSAEIESVRVSRGYAYETFPSNPIGKERAKEIATRTSQLGAPVSVSDLGYRELLQSHGDLSEAGMALVLARKVPVTYVVQGPLRAVILDARTGVVLADSSKATDMAPEGLKVGTDPPTEAGSNNSVEDGTDNVTRRGDQRAADRAVPSWVGLSGTAMVGAFAVWILMRTRRVRRKVGQGE